MLGEDLGEAYNTYYDINRTEFFHGFSVPNLLTSPPPGTRFDACKPPLYAYRQAGPASTGTTRSWPGGMG